MDFESSEFPEFTYSYSCLCMWGGLGGCASVCIHETHTKRERERTAY